MSPALHCAAQLLITVILFLGIHLLSERFVLVKGFGGSSPGLDSSSLRAFFKGGTQVTQTLAQKIVLKILDWIGWEERSPW